MDARLHPEKALGINIGDSHMIRNAGGRVSPDALRSLAISQQLLGTNEIYIIHHTDCGMVTFKNEDIRGLLKERLGADASDIDFLPFGDSEKSVLDDIAIVKNSPLINPGTPIVGFLYDVRTGKVSVVGTDETPARA
jgi:carbonic anhydrase